MTNDDTKKALKEFLEKVDDKNGTDENGGQMNDGEKGHIRRICRISTAYFLICRIAYKHTNCCYQRTYHTGEKWLWGASEEETDIVKCPSADECYQGIEP